MKNNRSEKENPEKVFINVNQRKIDIFSTIFSFFLIWEVYWSVFNLFSPQDTMVDILAIFGILIIIIPCTMILKTKILKFLRS